RHFAADLAVQRRGVDRFDEADAAAAGAEGVDRGALAAAEGGDNADTGDGDAEHDGIQNAECRMQNCSASNSEFCILNSEFTLGAARRCRSCRRTSSSPVPARREWRRETLPRWRRGW